MECNRDEAVRARNIAEEKYARQDFAGAKKFVLKAQQLFPTLEGLSQMLSVMEVHSVAQVKIGSNETDWYGILQVEPGADDSTVKKQYRKLALLLHPDKNKALGAEAAFKLIGEAWGILSDKTKRAVHNMRRSVKPKVPHVRVVMEPNMQAFQTPHNAAPPAPAPTPNPPTAQPSGTFWTACPKCLMQYQYHRTYENCQLQCPKCKALFLARDIHTTPADTGATGYWPHFEGPRQDFNFNKPAASDGFNGATAANGFMNGGMGPFSTTFPNTAGGAGFFSPAAAAAAAGSRVATAAAAAAAASATAPATNSAADVVQQTYQKVKRERVEAEKEIKRKEKEMRRKEKEDQRKEKEEQRKSRDAERAREAMDRLMTKRNQNRVKVEEMRRKVDVRVDRKLKRKRRGGSPEEEGEDLDDEEPKPFEQGLQDDLLSATLPRRRSSRNKKNVANYKVDVSDDSDLEEFPASKRNKLEGDADADDSDERSSEENGREPGRQQVRRENGGKGKSVQDDGSHEKRGSSRMNGTGEFDGEGGARNNDGTPKKDSCNSDFVEASRRFEGVARESKMFESPRDALKMKSGRPSQQIESPSAEKEMDYSANQEGGRAFKTEDFRDEKSPSKSPRTRRIRVKSPKVPYPSHSVDKEEGSRPQQPVSPPRSTVSLSSSDKEDEEEQDQDADSDGMDSGHIVVPDPDFHDFDRARTEENILAGQVWALYDDDDGMPRFYARVSKVLTKPFKASVNWLELSPDKTKSWMDTTGLSITCGEFKVGKPTVVAQINTFSHIVVDKAAGKGMVKIHPKKDQVWAIYRDCDPEQRVAPSRVPKLKSRGHTYSYEMVEILSDFSEERGVKTVKLVKVKGYKTLFQRQCGQDAFRSLKASELQKFSHSVPIFRMPDTETDRFGVPRGSVELDPASTPDDLIVKDSGDLDR